VLRSLRFWFFGAGICVLILAAGWTFHSQIRAFTGLPTMEDLRLRFIRPRAALTDIPGGRVMVVLVTGQSNAGNYGPPNVFQEHAGLFNFYAGTLYRAQDPMPGSDNAGSGPWLELGRLLMERDGYSSVIFALAVQGGTPIREWIPGRPMQRRVIEAGRGLQAAHLPPTHILWQQGESDSRAFDGTASEDYAKAFHAFLGPVRAAGIDAPVYVALASRTVKEGPDAAVRQAQQSLVNAGDKVFAGPDADQLGPEFRHDGTHFTAEGLRRLAALWYESLASRP
jgi:hypothetical protein